MTEDLVAFLAARLDERDAAAKLAADPERELRDVEAKRKILRFVVENEVADFSCQECGADWPQLLGALAAVDSDHPDYRQEWAP